MVHLSWRLDRADRIQVERLAERIANVPAEEARRRRQEVLDLGRRLLPGLPDPLPGLGVSPDRKRLARPVGPDDPDDPARLMNRLESTADGCRWLLDRWAEKRRAPDEGLAWPPADMIEAIRLLGKQPLDAIDDRQVLSIFLACFALDRDRPDSFAALWDGLTAHDVQYYRERLLGRRLGDSMPGTKDQARALLLEVVDEAVAQLRSQEQRCREREEALAATQASRLLFDDSAEGEYLRRHQLRFARAIVRQLEQLRRIQRDREARAAQVLDADLPTPPSVEAPVAQMLGAGLPTPPSSGPKVSEARAVQMSGAGIPIPTPSPSGPKVSRSPTRARNIERTVTRLIRILGALTLTALFIPALRPNDRSSPPGPLDALSHSTHEWNRDGSPGHPRDGFTGQQRPGDPGTGASDPRIEQNELNNRVGQPPSWVQTPISDRPADRSRGPPGPGGEPSLVDRPFFKPPDRRGVAVPRALGGYGPAGWANLLGPMSGLASTFVRE